MLKTTVYLPDELKRELGLLAEETGESEANLIRLAIAELVARRRTGRTPTVPLFTSRRSPIARRADALSTVGPA